MTKTMTIYAEKLVAKADFSGKYAKLNKDTLGDNYADWKKALLDCLAPAYHIYELRHNNGMSAKIDINQDALYAKVNALRDLIGEIKGAKLNSSELANTLIGYSHTFRKAAISNEAATAECNLETAKVAKNVIEKRPITESFTAELKAQAIAQAEEKIKDAKSVVDTLMQKPGNYRDIPTMVSDTTFLNNIEKEIRTIANDQNAKTLEQVLAEKKARNKANRERRNSK